MLANLHESLVVLILEKTENTLELIDFIKYTQDTKALTYCLEIRDYS